MWTWLASFLGGPVVNGLINAYKAKLEAANTEGAQGADLAAKAIAAEIEARARARRRSSSPSRGGWTALQRALVKWSFAVFVVKCVIWDTVLGLGTTEPLGGDIQAWAGWVMALWFGGRSLEKIATVIWRGR